MNQKIFEILILLIVQCHRFGYSFKLLQSVNLEKANACLNLPLKSIPSDNTNADLVSTVDDKLTKYSKLFGSELFGEEGIDYYMKNGTRYKIISPDKRDESMQPFYNLRLTLLTDNIFIYSIGICLVWYFGTFKDVYSYSVGGLLGIVYSVLLGRYVEGIGGGGNTGGGGSARFLPVILLILIYGKFKDQSSIIPELLGFFSYKVAPVLQIFNDENYDDKPEV